MSDRENYVEIVRKEKPKHHHNVETGPKSK
jgi:hypothetical protein